MTKNSNAIEKVHFVETNSLLPISVNDPIMQPWHTFDEFAYWDGHVTLLSLGMFNPCPGSPKWIFRPATAAPKFTLDRFYQSLFFKNAQKL